MDSNDAVLVGPVEESRFPGQRMCQLFSHQAESHSNAIALIWQDGETSKRYSMTMDQLDKKSNKLARGIVHHCGELVALNKDGDRVVMICIPPSWKLICTILAVWKAGACYLPVEPPAPKERVRHMLQEAKPFLVISDWDTEDLFPNANEISWTSLEHISEDLTDGPLSSGEQYPNRYDPIEIILYTSGSTGLPKGVRIKSSSLLNRLEWQWRRFPFSKEEETCCFKSSITFIDSIAEIWAPLLNPQYPLPVLVLQRGISSNPQLLISLLNKYKVNRIVLVPSLLNMILKYLKITNDNSSLKHLKMWVCGGETISCSLANEFFDWSERNGGSHVLGNFYGSTETMADISYHVMERKQDVEVNGKVPIGIPVDNTILYLLDAQMRQVNSGEIGELYVAGKHVAPGYLNGRDSFCFIENTYYTVDPEYKILFKTGDYASVYKGILMYEGRTDSQVKVKGNRVDLSEIERALNKLKEVQKGVVLCYNTGQVDQELVAFVVVNEDVLTEPADIQKMISKSLPSYAIPQVIIMDQIPLLINGKIDRQHLLHHYSQLAKFTNGMEFDLKGLPDEKKPAMRCLLSTISSLLPPTTSKLTPKASFYNIGGNSLNSVLTVAKLSEAGYNISISDFISSETLLDIVNKMTLNINAITNSNEIDLNNYKFDQISEKNKPEIYRLITESFYNKSYIEIFMDPPVEKDDYIELLDIMWPMFIKNPLSFVTKDANTNEVIGCMLLMNILDLTPFKLQSNYEYVNEFADYMEIPLRAVLPEGKIMHSTMLATDLRLNPKENIKLSLAMELKTIEIARQNNFIGIFTTNTSPLTKQISETIMNYKKLKSYQLNQFVASDGRRPFKKADDSVIVTCEFKKLC
ncbi:beta-alanyl-bioamine nonribosomal peptide synthetase ebony [Halyomorpha halys]|uniref:beta-alanyl-bioamine nonribosomal peptide synthetase ebony n=1 Tax=Halyomorpha halys TaxID=286706 RepID=UPI0006D4DF7F|nr:uncharacterized protein LOC106681699 [Halyomorpha halys]